jgi:LysM repeat protein
VAPGETLAEIAHRFSTPAASISAINQRAADQPEAGDMLVIPASYPAARASSHPAGAAPQRKIAHRGTPSKKAPVHKAAAAPYKTAGVTARHPASAN